MSAGFRRTKIVVTIGPASCGPEMIQRLARAGMDVARLNFSHGSHQEHIQRIQNIRAAARVLGRPITIIQDLQGPKIRIGTLPGDQMVLKPDQVLILVPQAKFTGQLATVPVDYPGLAADVRPGMRILVDDGMIRLEVIEVSGEAVQCRVVDGGLLRSRKGVNVPDAPLRLPSLTEKDLADLDVGIRHGVDYVALSFVRSPEDIRHLKSVLRQKGCSIPVIAKIEKPQALERLEEVAEEADALMVARGDLGVELAPERVPLAQKRIIRLCNQLGKPVITATQMLESMVSNPVPTRAEASDVANAIIDGTDAVMLSAETSVGAYPVEAVEFIHRLAVEVEAHTQFTSYPPAERTPTHAIAEATGIIDSVVRPACIVVFTISGFTAKLVAAERSKTPVLALTTDPRVYHALNLVWGIRPVLVDRTVASFEDLVSVAEVVVKDARVAGPGDTILVLGGIPAGKPRGTNFIKVHMLT